MRHPWLRALLVVPLVVPFIPFVVRAQDAALSPDDAYPFFSPRWFVAGGVWMYPLLALGVVGLAAAMFHAAAPSRALLGVAGICLTATLAVGAVGMFFSRKNVEEALAHVAPGDAEVIRRWGHREAQIPLELGGAILFAGLAPLIIGSLRMRGSAPS